MGEDKKNIQSVSSPLCHYHQEALRENDATDHDIDLAVLHGMDCVECRRLAGDVLQAKVDLRRNREQ